MESDENSGIFGEDETDHGPLDQLHWDLSHFRKEKYFLGKSTMPADAKDALKWPRDSTHKYPAV